MSLQAQERWELEINYQQRSLRLFECGAELVTGRGAGLRSAGYRRKVQVIKKGWRFTDRTEEIRWMYWQR